MLFCGEQQRSLVEGHLLQFQLKAALTGLAELGKHINVEIVETPMDETMKGYGVNAFFGEYCRFKREVFTKLEKVHLIEEAFQMTHLTELLLAAANQAGCLVDNLSWMMGRDLGYFWHEGGYNPDDFKEALILHAMSLERRLTKDIHINVRRARYRKCPLHFVVRTGSLDVLHFGLFAGAPPSENPSLDRTSLGVLAIAISGENLRELMLSCVEVEERWFRDFLRNRCSTLHTLKMQSALAVGNKPWSRLLEDIRSLPCLTNLFLWQLCHESGEIDLQLHHMAPPGHGLFRIVPLSDLAHLHRGVVKCLRLRDEDEEEDGKPEGDGLHFEGREQVVDGLRLLIRHVNSITL